MFGKKAESKEYKYYLIPCPHCGQSSSYQLSLPSNGSGYCQCRFCHKSFSIRMERGNISRITK